MKFKLTKEQIGKYELWRKTLNKVDYGAIGGGAWFMFCPTGLGGYCKSKT